MRYRHTQVGTVTLVLVGVAAAVMLGACAVSGHPVGIAVACIMVAMAPLFGWLTVVVGDGFLTCCFGVGLIRKRWPLADIREVSVVRTAWIHGWGIHLTPRGWLYNVSGLGAVEIVLASGKKARIGSDEPDKLAEAIRQSLGRTA